MIKGLQLLILFRKAAVISPYNGIHTDSVLLARFKGRKISRAFLDEPGVRNRRDILQEDSDYPDEIMDEHELDDDLDMMKVDKAYDEDVREHKRYQDMVKLKITASKFFKSRPQPMMLTYNERLCIQYLHKQDPVQWDLKTLSESFPATPDTVKKIIKSKRKITPERAKKMDSVVQKNWELLSEDKLNAEPHVLNHLKKFVNRREVLLEQIKNETFYLPKIKDEPVWNQGEMNSILTHYENTVKKLAEENSSKALSDTSSEKKDKKSSLDLVQEQIKAESLNIPETKDSFLYGNMINTFRKHTTLEELENKLLKKAERTKKLDLSEKVIIENKLGVGNENYMNKIESITPPVREKKVTRTSKAEKKVLKKFDNDVHLKSRSSKEMNKKDISFGLNYTPPDENTYSGLETDVGKILDHLKNKPQVKEKLPKTKVKKEIDFSDPERIKRENDYFDKEVLDIKNTAFWNNKRSSKEKELAEATKIDLDEPVADEYLKKSQKIFVLDPDPYPERIKIPKNKQGSGLTFRIKDCYYDDDGEFLYRVPGMTK